MAEMYSETADFKDPSLGKGIVKQTREQTARKYADLNALFPNLKDEILEMYPSGDNHVIVEFLSTGTAPDSTKFELPICTIFTIENGKITKDFTYYDNSQE
jgi:ketosteroid isomerase-like protein